MLRTMSLALSVILALPMTLVLSVLPQMAIAQVPSGSSVAPLFDIFDALSSGRAGSQGSSSLSMIDSDDNWQLGTQWTPQERYDETDVFHVELRHRSNNQNWDIRIGKGGQLYSWNLEGERQLIPPQGHRQGESPWVDDIIMCTWRDRDASDDNATLPGVTRDYANSFVHGAGMYIREEMDPILNKPFYNPMFAQEFSSSQRSYSCLTWGLIPTPSINRSDILIYTNYRHLGNGVLEVTYYGYNFGDGTYDDNAFPWAMVRLSEFPSAITSNSSGSGSDPWPEGDLPFPNRFNIMDRGGWVGRSGSSADSLTFTS